MRVASERRLLTAEPGETVEVVLDVVNTTELIDGVTARVIGLPDAKVRTTPEVLALFPNATGQITVFIEVPRATPAGLHPLLVEVVSHVTGESSEHLDLDLSVAARPGVKLSRQPEMIRAKRGAQFIVHVENTGNVALDATFTATSPERVLTTFTPPSLRVEPGAIAPVMLTVKGPKMFTGAETEREVTINLVGRRVDHIPAMDEAEAEPELQQSAKVVLRQKPLISTGLLTAGILTAIIALWAVVMLLSMRFVFGADPMTKTAPASYFPVSVAEGLEPGSAAAQAADAAAPAGATSKDGTMDPGAGSVIRGTVFAESNNAPVGRILVTAYRMGRNGPVEVSSAASQSDGTYELAGLFPTGYFLKFSADGYDDVWSPSEPAGVASDAGTLQLQAGETGIAVGAQQVVEGEDMIVTGKPGSISGRIDPGDTLTTVTTTVTARMLDAVGEVATAEGTTDSDGNYSLDGLVAPGTYELSFATEGYTITTQVEAIVGGEQHLVPTILLNAGDGQISGVVCSAEIPDGGSCPSGAAMGGVTVSTTLNGQKVSVLTPTVGEVGQYVIDGLPTPATYVLTFTTESGTTATAIVNLEAGESASGQDVTIASGTATATGRLVRTSGAGVGGATLLVTGQGISRSTTTTNDGTFAVGGLQAGSYTFVFTSGSEQMAVAQTLVIGANTLGSFTLGATGFTVAGTVTACSPGPGTTVALYGATSSTGIPALFDTTTFAYQAVSVPQGRYTVTVKNSSGTVCTRLVDVTGNLTGVDVTP